MNFYVGQDAWVKGCITRDDCIRGRSLSKIEKLLGFRNGRLSLGAAFIILNGYPAGHEFEFAGYTQVASHRHVPLNPGEYNIAKLKENVIEYWRENKMILTKVIPAILHNHAENPDIQYPPGEGIPQWKVSIPGGVKGTVVAVIQNYTEVYQPRMDVKTKDVLGFARKSMPASPFQKPW